MLVHFTKKDDLILFHFNIRKLNTFNFPHINDKDFQIIYFEIILNDHIKMTMYFTLK